MQKVFRSVVVLTGAGVSAESGIRTFRAADGLWEEHSIDEVATPEGFERNPQLVYQFYNDRRRALQTDAIQPNAAHFALANFEARFKGDFLLVTQNIDNLHERAGSNKLIHMHGELLKMRCINSRLVFDIREELNFDTECRCCRSPGNLRPHVVWFGEMPLGMLEITDALKQCDLFIAIGTSGNVYPAAGFYQTAKIHKAHTAEFNLETTGSSFAQHVYGPATQTVPSYLEVLLNNPVSTLEN
jgi:NAD-dependent deacetylase